MISTRQRPLLLGVPFLPAPHNAIDLSRATTRHAGQNASAHKDDLEELVAGNTTFAFDIFPVVETCTTENVLISPYSISQALAMTYAGARGDTATEMAEVLSFTLDSEALHEAFSALNAGLLERGGPGGDAGALRIANSLWGEQTYPFDPAFSQEIEELYGAGLRETDFLHAPEESRLEINDWVADETEDRIQDIVRQGDITEGTILALVNAIFFYGPWENQFEPWATRDDAFFLIDGTPISVPFMVQDLSLLTARGEGFLAIELPYANGGFAMTIILPDEGSFGAVARAIDADVFNAMVDDLSWTDALLFLPSFGFEFGTVDLTTPLMTLGMERAFSRHADFRGMVDVTRVEPDNRPHIGMVLHKAFIRVDENGTEAAAATVVLMSPAGSPPYSPPPPEIHIDRPFLFAIRDTVTGTVLFLGRVMDPRP